MTYNTLDRFLKIPELALNSLVFKYATFKISTEISSGKVPNIPQTLMLGKQAEFLFEYAIKNSKRYQLLLSNVQIQGATETLGELDYIIYDTQTSETYHLELPVSFIFLTIRLKDLENNSG